MRTLVLLFIMLVFPVASYAQSLQMPEGTVVLTVSGAIENSNDGGTAKFDIEMLKELGQSELVTSTIWTDGAQVFTGIPLLAILEAVGAQGSKLRAMAVNDYMAEIPVSDAIPDGAFVAYELNGIAMTLRDKGPLWIVYPYDQDPNYRTSAIYTRSVWQLDRIEVLP